jgi:hypothetical protein
MREDTVDVQTHYNIAAVRLLLYQKYCGFPLDRELTLIVPRCRDAGDETAEVVVCDDENHIDMTMAEGSSDGKLRYVTSELPYAWNEKSLQDIVENVIEGKDLVPTSSLKKHLRTEVFLCWKDPSSTGKKKGAKNSKRQEEEEDLSIPHETLMGALLELTNASSGDTPTAEKKKSTRRAERGFAGTLLHSLSSAPNSDEAKKSDAGDSAEENQDTDAEISILVSERDDSVDTVKAGSSRKLPAAPAVKAKEARAATAAARSTQDVVVVDESDENDNPQSDDDNSVVDSDESNEQGNGRQLRSSILDPMVRETLSRVVECLSDGESGVSSMSKCIEAVKWAVDQNPEYTIDQLTDAAIAKYLDETY